jgi:REP element-mobilizing transposase RayT
MIIGYHFIFSAYGFWLPNDPRGSWSEVVREFELRKFGPATKISTTRSVAAPTTRSWTKIRCQGGTALPASEVHEPIGCVNCQGIGDAITDHGYVINALAILPDHVHLIMRYHTRPVDKIAAHLKAKATANLSAADMQPLAKFISPVGRIPSPWARNYWCPFIFDEDHYLQAIAYVEANPIKAGLRPQRWNIVTPFSP